MPEADKDRFKEIMQSLAAAQASFEHNIQDATDAWSLHIQDIEELSGIPKQAMERAAEHAQEKQLEGWLWALDYPSYDSIMTHAHNRQLREIFYRAWSTRGSDQGDSAAWDNSENIISILALRHEAANLVGFESYADYSLATKMAGSSDEVLNFLRELSARSRNAAEQRTCRPARFRGYATTALGPDVLAGEIQAGSRISVSNEELRQYFPATHGHQWSVCACRTPIRR